MGKEAPVVPFGMWSISPITDSGQVRFSGRGRSTENLATALVDRADLNVKALDHEGDMGKSGPGASIPTSASMSGVENAGDLCGVLTTVYTCADGSGTFFAQKHVLVSDNEDGSSTNTGPG
jgi:hypothetical protein